MRPPIPRSGLPNLPDAMFVTAPPIGMLADPLEYILADHGRQRSACAALEAIAAAGHIDRAAADSVRTFLAHDVPLHFADEEEDLFPAIRLRALREDAIEPVLLGLVTDHHACRAQLEKIVEALTQARCDETVILEPSVGAIMRAYSLTEQRHLAIENAIVIPIAQRRLKAADLAIMSCHMRARRGVLN